MSGARRAAAKAEAEALAEREEVVVVDRESSGRTDCAGDPRHLVDLLHEVAFEQVRVREHCGAKKEEPGQGQNETLVAELVRPVGTHASELGRARPGAQN